MTRTHLLTWPLVVASALIASGGGREAVGAAPMPTRCIAYWDRPAADCRLDEAMRVEAVGRDEASARDLAMERLLTAMDALRTSHELGAPDIMRAVVLNATRGCTEHLVQEAVVTCFPEPHLRQARFCQVALPMAQCGEGQPYAVEGPAWREGEAAREALCESMGDELGFLSGDPQAIKACEASCWQTSHLECGLR